jgi:transposase
MKEVSKEKSNSIKVFSEDFKKSKVNELLEKRITVSQLCKLYDVSRTAVYKWLFKYSPLQEKKVKLVVEMESESNKTMLLQQRVAELERIIGQKQLEIDYLDKVLEISSDEMGFDLKKNFSAKLSNGSGSTKKASE